jgi:hypothetical protein
VDSKFGGGPTLGPEFWLMMDQQMRSSRAKFWCQAIEHWDALPQLLPGVGPILTKFRLTPAAEPNTRPGSKNLFVAESELNAIKARRPRRRRTSWPRRPKGPAQELAEGIEPTTARLQGGCSTN